MLSHLRSHFSHAIGRRKISSARSSGPANPARARTVARFRPRNPMPAITLARREGPDTMGAREEAAPVLFRDERVAPAGRGALEPAQDPVLSLDDRGAAPPCDPRLARGRPGTGRDLRRRPAQTRPGPLSAHGAGDGHHTAARPRHRGRASSPRRLGRRRSCGTCSTSDTLRWAERTCRCPGTKRIWRDRRPGESRRLWLANGICRPRISPRPLRYWKNGSA